MNLHDATNAEFSMKHDVAKQAANQVTLEAVDKFFFDQRISLPVVTIGGKELKLTFWRDQVHDQEIFANPRTVVKATCSAFQPELGRSTTLKERREYSTQHIVGNHMICGLSQAICWELENVSWKEGDHFQDTARKKKTLRAVKELKTRSAKLLKAESPSTEAWHADESGGIMEQRCKMENA